MHLTLKSGFAALVTFLLPGIGQALYGEWMWAIMWFCLCTFISPIIIFFAAAHCLFIK